jgi:hypothetical protein
MTTITDMLTRMHPLMRERRMVTTIMDISTITTGMIIIMVITMTNMVTTTPVMFMTSIAGIRMVRSQVNLPARVAGRVA